MEIKTIERGGYTIEIRNNEMIRKAGKTSWEFATFVPAELEALIDNAVAIWTARDNGTSKTSLRGSIRV